MDKRELRKLVLDIGYLVNKDVKPNGDVDISKVMDDLNTMDSYKPFQLALKENKEFKKISKEAIPSDKYEQWFGIIVDLMGYKKDEIDNTTLGHLFQDIALLKSRVNKELETEEFD